MRHPRSIWILPLVSVVLLVTAGQCSGVTNTPPSLSSIADASTPRTDSIEIAFSITDEDPDSVVVTASSDDQTLVSDADIEVLGSGSARTLRIMPSPVGSGSVVIALVAVDAEGLMGSGSFGLEVRIPFETELPKLRASDAATEDQFGWSVAVSGDYAVVGAFGDDDAGSLSGSAYVFERSGSSWNEVAKLRASDAATEDQFGYSVAVSGDYAVVGAIGDDDAGSLSGSAYVFERSGSSWNEVAKLRASDAATEDLFGYSVAVSGDYAVVGAIGDGDAGSSSGSAYVFERSGSSWNEVAKLRASDAATEDLFGYSIAVSGDYAVVGAGGDDDAGSSSGSAYVFERSGSTWSEVAKLRASDAATGDQFGYSVAVSGDTIVVGAFLGDDGGSSSGSAYVFERSGSTWSEVAKLRASDAAAGVQFGYSVAVSGDTVLVGARYDDDGGPFSGSAYVFERSGSSWNEIAKLRASDAATEDQFGWSVAVSGDTIVVGSFADDDGGSSSGSAYVFVK